MNGPDLEKPYVDAAKREDALDEFVTKATNDLLFKLRELQEAQAFVNAWCDDPASNLALMLTIICTPAQPPEVMQRKLIEAMSSIIMPACQAQGQRDMEAAGDDYNED